MPLSSKTLEELLDLARGEQFPTPLERELTARLGVLAAKLEAVEMVQERPSRKAVFTGKLSLPPGAAVDPFGVLHVEGIKNYMENKT